MKARLKPQVYIRHVGDESVVVSPRTGGCTVLKDARSILEKFISDWCWTEEIARTVAKECGCGHEDVAEGVYAILGELESQGFAEREGWQEHIPCDFAAANQSVQDQEAATRSDDSPLGDFYMRHNLPAELHMDLTDRCNEACVHCYIPKGGGMTMPTELALKVLREFREMEGLSVYFSGGECMLHPDFAVILREAKRLGLNIIVMSNLTLCDASMVELLKEIDPQFVNVSLYSMKAGEHDAITQVSGSWAKTMTAIRSLKDAGVHVRLATPILRQNKSAVEELQKFAAEMKMHDVIECDIIGRTNHDCSNQCHALDLNEAEEVIRRYRQSFCHEKLDALRCEAEARVCEVGDFKLNVNAHGDYYPCDGGHGLFLGNAAVDTLSDVWRGEKLNTLRRLKNRDFPKCVGCADRPWCKVCVMRNFNETGDMFSPAPARCALTAIHRKVWEER